MFSFSFTYIFFQVLRIKTVRAITLSRSNSSSSLASLSGRRSVMTKLSPSTPSTTKDDKTFGQKVFSILLGGEKGSALPGYIDLISGRGRGARSPKNLKTKQRVGQQQENPVARLKLLLVCFIFLLGSHIY